MQSDARIAVPFFAPPRWMAIEPKQRRAGRTSHFRSIFPGLLVAWDMAATLGCGIAAAALPGATGVDGLLLAEVGLLPPEMLQTSAVGALLSPLLLRHRNLGAATTGMIGQIARGGLALVGLATALTVACRPHATMPFAWAGAWFALVVCAAFAGRVLAHAGVLGAAWRFGGERVAVIGGGSEAEWLRRMLRRAAPAGVELVPTRPGERLSDVVTALLEGGRRGEIDRVVLAQPGLADERVRQIAHRLKAAQIEVASLFPVGHTGAVRPETGLADIPLFLVARRPQAGAAGLAKAAMDRGFALLLLLWLAPLMLLIGLAIRLDSRGPALFRQRRRGVNGGEFEIYKFRTMTWQGRDAGNGAMQTGRTDRRITRLGGFLRGSSLDEVPQLLNVLNGTMSLVGPRPHPTAMRTEHRRGEDITPEYPHRHRVKPGITGLAQINGLRGATETAAQLRRRIELDNQYIETWSPWLDLRILAATPFSLLRHRDNAF